ncbi:universal stress protein [Thermodesulfobacteriota bacterium]
MNNSILIALNDSISSRVMIDFIAGLPLRREEVSATLLHVYRKPAAVEDLMGQRFTSEQPSKFSSILEQARNKLVEKGFLADRITLNLVDDPYPTVADAVIDQFKKGEYDMVVIGRKNMSKAEEFVRGDISIKLIRALEGLCLLVVKTP